MKPPWLKTKIPSGKNYHQVKNLLGNLNLHTVCEEARCPNVADCWNRQTATVIIMGDICTRRCGFCAITTGRPRSLDREEPEHVAQAVFQLGLKHVVITSVDRDDLPDGGAGHIAKTIIRVKEHCPHTQVEVLIPDLRGQKENLDQVFAAGPHILNHNLETVASLQKRVRPQAGYHRSLQVLQWAAEAGLVAKSGIMLGLGETDGEIRQALHDLRNQGRVSILTIGQYLRPSQDQLEVVRYYAPEEFKDWKSYAEELGIESVASGPFVRSSYHADEAAAPWQKKFSAIEAVEVIE